jgi:hypothetical protein
MIKRLQTINEEEEHDNDINNFSSDINIKLGMGSPDKR